MLLNKKAGLIIFLVVLLAFSPIIGVYGFRYAIHLRHRMQERFAEIHAALSGEGEDEPSGDGGLTQAQIDARDNIVVPIATAPGTVQWDILAKADTRMTADNIIRPVFNEAIKHLDGIKVTAKGYMVPLDAFGRQTHFLLSPYPPSCPFCLPAGPNELIEIKPDEPVAFTYDPVTVFGRFQLLQSDDDIKQGMFYRMENAVLKD